MNKEPVYIYNKKTFEYEEVERKETPRSVKVMAFVLVSLLISLVYYYIYFDVMGMDDPRTAALMKENRELRERMDILGDELALREERLQDMKMRDNGVYRSLFGMEPISDEVRMAGFGGVDRYSRYDGNYSADLMKSVAEKTDILYSMASVQSESLDEISGISGGVFDLAAAMPAVSPVLTDGSCRLSSMFGRRRDPWTKIYRTHDGIDISGKAGTPIYATGDGVVSKIYNDAGGYGNYVMIDHGFGYRTRYAHLRSDCVEVGQKVKRGEKIGEMGNTGRSMGNHLHYEVIYMNRPVNPLNYFSLSVDSDIYLAMIQADSEELSDEKV